MLKRLIVMLLSFSLFGLSACSAPRILYAIDDYEQFLQQIKQEQNPDIDDEKPVEPNPEQPDNPVPEPPEPDNIPQFDGLTYIAGGFTHAGNFTGGYAYVQSDKATYVIDSAGRTIDTEDDLSDSEFVNGYCVVENNGLYALAHIAGGMLSDYIYTSIQKPTISSDAPNIFLCFTDAECHVYFEGKITEKVEVPKNTIQLFGNMILLNGRIVDEDLREDTIAGCTVWGRPSDGRICIQGKTGLYGYADEAGQIATEPQFLTAVNYHNGYAIVCTPTLNFRILDTAGQFIATVEGLLDFPIQPNPAHDGCSIVQIDGVNHVLSLSDGVLTELPFLPADNRVYGRYVIDTSRNKRLYAYHTKQYVGDYIDVRPADGWFIVEGEAGVCLLDETLNEIARADSITESEGIFRLQLDDCYYYYQRTVSAD